MKTQIKIDILLKLGLHIPGVTSDILKWKTLRSGKNILVGVATFYGEAVTDLELELQKTNDKMLQSLCIFFMYDET